MPQVHDLSEIFKKPPYRSKAYMDLLAERLVVEATKAKYGTLQLPISTDTLTCMLERDAEELDLYADLSSRGEGVEGVTDFFVGARPKVKISAHLSESRNENRLRTTLAHEYGHVCLHNSLVQSLGSQSKLFSHGDAISHCHRDSTTAEKPKKGNLIEYQAWYFAGAILMPKTHILSLVSRWSSDAGFFQTLFQHSDEGLALQMEVANVFSVSTEAARIRLLKLDCLSETELPPTLF